MSLDLYRRHAETCPHRAGAKEPGKTAPDEGRAWLKCNCPLWADGELNGKRFRRSLGLRDLTRAVKRLEAWEKGEGKGSGAAGEPLTVEHAIESYLGDCRARKLAASTITSYGKTLEHFRAFCDGAAIKYVQEITLTTLTDFRAGRRVTVQDGDETHERDIAGSTSGKELETMRAFCAFGKKHGWFPENYAKEVKAPKEDECPTLPFTAAEVDAILGACEKLEDGNPNTRERTRARARAFCLVMLYSGLRISDTVKLRRKTVDLTTGKMLLRVMKTGKKLYVRLGQPAIDALSALPGGGEYFFWTGESKLATAVGNARKTISRVLAVAKVAGHPHRFRDTFSVRLLEKGEDLRTVQLLLGHTSIKTTEKHYAPFVDSFQRILDAATSKLDFVSEPLYQNVPKRRASDISHRFAS